MGTAWIRVVVALCIAAVCLTSSNSAVSPVSAAQSSDETKASKELLDRYASILGKASPWIGAVAEGVIKVIDFAGFFNEPDPVAAAMKVIGARLAELQTQIGQLEANLASLRNEQMRERNQHRIWRLRDIRDELALVAAAVARKSGDQRDLADRARTQVNKFLDLELWTWSDLATHDHVWPPREGSIVRAGTMTAPDFKSWPTLDYYTAALAVWISAMHAASNGNPESIQSNYGAELERHIRFLTLRASWHRRDDRPESLPEQVQHRITARFESDVRPTNGVCEISEFTLDEMARRYKFVENVRYNEHPPNTLCNTGWIGQTRFSTDSEDRLDRAYGLGVMQLAADTLGQFRKYGRVGAPFIGVFDPTTFTATDLYQVTSDGEVAWRRHMLAVKPVPEAQRQGPRTAAGRVNGPIGGAAPGPLVVGMPVEPEVVGHRLLGPTSSQHAWRYTQVFAGGAGTIYGVAPDQRLIWQRHDPQRGWQGPRPVGTGWAFRHVFAAGDGIIYAIDNQGQLLWYQHKAHLTGEGLETPSAWDARSGMLVGTGWGDVRHVFSGGRGIIYVVTQDGRLLWYRHNRYADPVRHPLAVPASRPAAIKEGLRVAWVQSWEGPREVGQGWGVNFVSSPGAGQIYMVTTDGRLRWYKHIGFENGETVWWANAGGQQYVELATGLDRSTAFVADLASPSSFKAPR